MVQFIILFLVTFAAYVLLSLTRKKDIIETHETKVRILAGLVVICLWVISSIQLGVSCYETADSHSISLKTAEQSSLLLLSQYLQMGICFFPAILVVLCYFNMNRYYLKRLEAAHRQRLNSEQRQVSHLAGVLSERIHLKRPPKVLFSAYEDIPPSTFGRRPGNASIVLPVNFKQILSETARIVGNCEERASLEKFVLLHELSHIKNSDLVFMSWAGCFLSSFKFWLLPYTASLVLLASLVGVQPWVSNQVLTNLSFLLLSCISFALFSLVVFSVSRQRELLADARASLYLNAHEIGLITSSRTKLRGMSALGALLSLISRLVAMTHLDKRAVPTLPTSILTRIVGFTGTGISGFWGAGVVGRLFATHPVDKERVAALRQQEYIGISNLVPSIGASAWIGVVAAFLAISGVVIPQICYYGSVGKFGTELSHFISVSALPFMMISYWLPFWNSFNCVTNVRAYLRVLASRLAVTAVCMFSATLALAAMIPALALLGSKVPNVTTYIKYSSALCILPTAGTFMLSVLLGTLMAVRPTRKPRPESIVVAIFALVPVASVPVGMRVLFGQGVGWLSIVGWTYIALFMQYTALLTNAFGIAGGESYCASSLFGKCDFSARMTRKKFLWHAAIGLVTSALFVLPVLSLGVILLYLFPLSRQMSDEAVGITLLLTFAVPWIGASWQRGLKRQQAIQSLRSAAHFAEVVALSSSQSDLPSKAVVTLSKTLHDPGGGYHDGTGVVNMESTFECVLPVKLLRADCGDEESIAKWVLKCQDKEGGFSVWPGAAPTLGNTHRALRVLQLLSGVENLDREKHEKWLLNQCKTFDLSRGPRKGYGLWEICMTLDCLDMLKAPKSCVEEIIPEKLINCWCRGKRSCKDTFNLVRCLEILGSLDNSIEQELRQHWVFPRSTLFANLRPDKNIEDISNYVQTIHILNKRDVAATRSQVSKVLENTLRGFEEIFQRSGK
jgi:hypothetical protein